MELIICVDKLLIPRNYGFINQCGFSKKELGIVRNLFFEKLKEHFQEKVNPITVKDLRGGLNVKFQNGHLREEDKLVLECFSREVTDMNVWKFFNEAFGKTKDRIIEHSKRIDAFASIEKFKELSIEWFRKFLNSWDYELENLVIFAIKEKHAQKCKLKAGFYNFSTDEIDGDVLKLIKMGKKSVPVIKKSIIQRLQIFNSEVRKSLCKYRRCIQHLPSIDHTNLYEWLEVAIKTTNEELQYDVTQDCHLQYYCHISKIIKF